VARGVTVNHFGADGPRTRLGARVASVLAGGREVAGFSGQRVVLCRVGDDEPKVVDQVGCLERPGSQSDNPRWRDEGFDKGFIMAGIEYHHIGHDPQQGALALWSIDQHWRLHEDRRDIQTADAAWLVWSHENMFPGINVRALGRVEIDRKAGSIHVSDPVLVRDDAHLLRVLSILDQRYPDTRWYLFGLGFKGESVFEHFGRGTKQAA